MSEEEKTDDVQEESTAEEKVVEKVVEVEVNVDYKDKWMRAQADYQNFQKEVEERRSEWVRSSELQILEEFIPVFNNFKTAFAHQPTDDSGWKSWSEGIGFIMKQFGDVLKSHDLEEIKTVGEPFDINKHEAAGEEPSDEYDDGVIIREVAAGYTMKDKVIVPAKVIVCKK